MNIEIVIAVGVAGCLVGLVVGGLLGFCVGMLIGADGDKQ